MTKRCLFKVVFSTILKDVLQTYFHFTEKILIKIFHCSSRFIWTVFSPFLTILNTRSMSWRNNDEYTYASMHINIFEDCPFSILIFLLMNDNVYMSIWIFLFLNEKKTEGVGIIYNLFLISSAYSWTILPYFDQEKEFCNFVKSQNSKILI